MKQSAQRSVWYRDNFAAPHRTQTGKRNRLHRGWIPGLAALGVLLLLVGSALLFSDGATPSDSSVDQNDHGFYLPIPGPEDNAPDGDSVQDFFRSYFTDDSQAYPASRIERAAPDDGRTLSISSAAGREALSLQALYAHCADSVVGIEALVDGEAGYYWGTGVVMSADGYIVTNQHIIGGTDSALVILADGTEHEARLVGEDRLTDLAVLKIEATGLTPAEFGDSAELSVGDRVAAIGNPLGSELSGTMTDGIISAINRNISLNGRSMTLLQTNAAINEGNSGGPLINLYGQIIGLTNMKMGNYYSSVSVEGLGFAIPSATVKAVADQLLASGAVEGRPGLGITVGAIPDYAATKFGLPAGLYVNAVSEGSDAAAQGVREGDVLLKVNGRAVTVTQDVVDIRDACAVGDTLTLTLWRNGETFEVSVTLCDRNTLY